MLPYYPRPSLAQSYALKVTTEDFGSTDSLFLGAPRRTGKSWFLQRDLLPALEARGALTLYVDLWKDTAHDPGELIAYTIGNALAQLQGVIAKTVQAVGLTKVSIKGVEFSLTDVGRQPGATNADALAELCDKAGKPVVFIVDEAQHAITTPDGMRAMFALKSARDTINGPGRHRFALIMSGSDQDKLLRLVNGNASPFLSSHIDHLAPLGRDFIDFLSGELVKAHPDLSIDNEALFRSFQRFNSRPEELDKAITHAIDPYQRLDGRTFNDHLAKAAEAYEVKEFDSFATAYRNLTPLQQAIWTRILAHGREGKLFDASSLAEYGKAHGKPVKAGTARDAVEALRKQNPPLIWKSERGEYAPFDGLMRRWYERSVRAGQWPPTTED